MGVEERKNKMGEGSEVEEGRKCVFLKCAFCKERPPCFSEPHVLQEKPRCAGSPSSPGLSAEPYSHMVHGE